MKSSSRLACVVSAMILAAGTAEAQNIEMMRSGEVVHPDGRREYVMPSTTVAVDITVKKESVRTGPYARFAQRYFGSIAPLTDKDIYSITAAQIGWYDNNSEPGARVAPLPAPVAPDIASHVSSGQEFPRVLPDKISMANKPPEEAAKDAAQAVFDIRKRRAELVTGEYAETVFGEGLRAAIERLDKMENEYLELFYGKQSVSYETKRFTVVPDPERAVYVVCRWSENGGLLPDTDLTGQPVLLEMKPQNTAAAIYPPVMPGTKKKNEAAADYVIADNVNCRVVEGKRELARRTIPVYQFGIRRTLGTSAAQ